MKKKRLIICGLVISMLCSIASVKAYADTLDSDAEIVERISAELENYLSDYYEGIYAFSDFEFIYESQEQVDNTIVYDIAVTADMMLTREPENSPFVRGMYSVKQDDEVIGNQVLVQEIIDNYLEEVIPYYMVPYRTGFFYRVEIDEDSKMQIYNRIWDGEMYQCEDIVQGEVYSDMLTYDDGITYVYSKLYESQPMGVITISGYNASAAVSYAITHAKDAPEFYKDGNSDCANFVSKCINCGEIPVDTAGKWYPASVWGDTGTAGENWMRTGHRDNGGVIPYFVDKGYLYSISEDKVEKGCIMSWNLKSHVAIVTYFDGTTIKYSQHSNATQTSTYHTYTSQDVTFYKFY